MKFKYYIGLCRSRRSKKGKVNRTKLNSPQDLEKKTYFKRNESYPFLPQQQRNNSNEKERIQILYNKKIVKRKRFTRAQNHQNWGKKEKNCLPPSGSVRVCVKRRRTHPLPSLRRFSARKITTRKIRRLSASDLGLPDDVSFKSQTRVSWRFESRKGLMPVLRSIQIYK